MKFNSPQEWLQSIDSLIQQSREFVTRDLDRAYETAEQVLLAVERLRASEGHHYLRGMAEGLYIQVTVHFSRLEYQLAIDKLITVTEIFEELHHEEGLVRCWNMGGIIYRQLGDFASATDLLQKSLQLAETMAEKHVVLMPLSSLASLHIYRDEHALALRYLQRALDAAHALGLSYQHAKISGNMCACYRALGQYPQALQAGLDALAYFEATEHALDQVYVLTSLSQTYLSLKQYEQARAMLERALDIATRAGMGSNRLQVLYDFGNYCLEIGDLERAEAYFVQVINEADQAQGDRTVYVAHRQLADVFKRKGDFERALDQLEQYLEKRDAILTQESERKLQNLETRLRTEQARKEAEYYRRRTQELERLREEEKEQYEQVTRIKEDLLSDTSHDLKNPLARIMINASFLKRHRRLDDKGIAYLDGIIDSAKLMNDLVVEALELVRLEMGRSPQLSHAPLSQIVSEAVQMHQTMAEAKRIRLEARYDVDTPLTVAYNAREMYRVMENLLSNALKYSNEGGVIQVTVTHTPTYVMVRVRDSGDGVSEEDMPRIFDRFFRSERHAHRPQEGTGLGLAIVKKIIDNHGGKIWVERVLEGGSAFCFTLPVRVVS
jgi:signal transduction histidine kinase